MRPPICDICDERFDPFAEADGGLITFKPSEEDQQMLERLRKPGMVGHPPNQEWFCGKHVRLAASLSHLTLREARAEMKKQLNM